MIRLGGILKDWAFHLCFIYTIRRNGLSRTGGFSARFNQAVPLFRKPSLIHNTQFAVDLAPVSDDGSTSFCGFKCSQIQGFQQRCITWKYAPLLI